jgi:hypothetical protein
VFAALAVSRWIEQTTGWSTRGFVRTARRYRTIQIQAGAHIVTAAEPLPDDLRHALDRIHHGHGAHQSVLSRVQVAPVDRDGAVRRAGQRRAQRPAAGVDQPPAGRPGAATIRRMPVRPAAAHRPA